MTSAAIKDKIESYGYVTTDTNTTYSAGTNISLDGTTFNVDDAFLKNDADDATTGVLTAGGFTTSGTLTLDSVGLSTVQTSAESFADNDTSLMTSAAIADKIESYGYVTTDTDTTYTGGTGINISGSNEISLVQNISTTSDVTFNDLTVSGNLNVNGTTTTIDTANLVVEDPLIKLSKDNNADTVDIGFYGVYGSSSKYTGLFRDANDFIFI